MLEDKVLSSKEYIEKFYREPSHAFEVKRLSLMLFDKINELIEPLPLKYRKVLEFAAVLHDIGYNIGAKNHNKHSYELIIKNGIKELDEQQTVLVAHIARYHRGAMPDKTKHREYGQLSKKERKVIKILSSVLRLCDGLDRAHLQLIKSLSVEYDKENAILTILLKSNIPNIKPDISSALKKKDLFEKVFDLQVVLKFV